MVKLIACGKRREVCSSADNGRPGSPGPDVFAADADIIEHRVYTSADRLQTYFYTTMYFLSVTTPELGLLNRAMARATRLCLPRALGCGRVVARSMT